MNETEIEYSEVGLSDLLQLRGHYWQSRQWTLLRQGLPAVLVTLMVLVPAMLSPLTRRWSVDRYRRTVNDAVRKNQYEVANLFLTKLDSLPSTEAEDDKLKFNRALIELARGENERAQAGMMDLAPADRVGYGPAHLWLVRKLIAEDAEIEGKNSDLILHHLNAYLTTDRKNVEVHLLLGNYHFRTGDQSLAIEHLKQTVESRPEMHFTLANLYDQTGEAELAVQHFGLAIPLLEAALKRNPDDENQRVSLALANYKLNRFNQAERTLLSGIDKDAPSTRLIETLSAFYLQESDRLRVTAKPDSAELATSLVLLSKALEFGPSNEDAIDRLAEIATNDGEVGQKALKQLLVLGKITPMAHLILGTNALAKGNDVDARRHLQQAYRQDPKMPLLLNNVAWMLAHQDPPRLDPALKLVNEAINNTPQTHPLYPQMVETRGQIYVDQKKWEDALADLEIALRSMPDNQDVHRSLAIVYRALGDEELAREHEQLASP